MSRHGASGTNSSSATPLARRIDELAQRAAREAAEHGPVPRLVAVQREIAALRAELAGGEGGLARVDARLTDLTERLSGAVSDAQQRQEAQVADVASSVSAALRQLEERQQQLDERHAALLARLEDEARTAAELRAQLLGELDSARTSLQPAVDEARDQVARQAEAMTSTVLAAVVTLLDERLGAAADQLAQQRTALDDVLVRMAELIADSGAATGSLDRTRQDLLREISQARGELHTTAGVMTGAQAVLDAGVRRIETSGAAMVRYLDDRDLALEAERDRLLREVLEDFADTLGARERRTVARRLIGVVDRRRDARDANRWRRANPQQGTDRDAPAAVAPPTVIDLDAAQQRRAARR
jgi:chromosome segregation ATPase